MLAHPGFNARERLEVLVAKHADPLELLQVVNDQKRLVKADACHVWGDYLGTANVDVLVSGITIEAMRRIPLEIARKVRAIGLYVIEGVLTVAMATPENTKLVRRLKQISAIHLSPVFCLPGEIDDAMSVICANERSLADSIAALERNALCVEPDLALARNSKLAKTEPLVRGLKGIIHFGLRDRTTAIPIEPREVFSRIRFRIDGTLRDILTFPATLHRAIISRLTIISDLNISESRFPQDGRFSMPGGTGKANFRR